MIQSQPQMPRTSHDGKERQMPRLRSLSAGMLVLLLAGILAACGGSPPEAAAPTATAPADQPTAAAPAAAEPTAAAPAEQPTAAPEAAAPTAAAAPAGAGGTLTVGRTATPDSLNPGVAYLSEAFD